MFIPGGDDDGYFNISNTGELSLQKPLNPQSVSDLQFILLIEANDEQNTAQLNLTVDIKTGDILLIKRYYKN